MALTHDEFDLDDETPGERLARELAEADYQLIHELRMAREAQGLSQSELGDRIGVTQASVSAFESGVDAKLSTIRRYARALGVVVSHSVRSFDSVSAGFVATPLPSTRTTDPGHTYLAPKQTDFAVAA